MSGDETFVVLVAVSIALLGWGSWYVRLLRFPAMGAAARRGLPLALGPVLVLGGVFALLRAAASVDVRESPVYLAFYMILGAAWLVLNRKLASWLGLSWIDDVHERRNPAATLALGGVLAGAAACYGGGNIGDGPGWWCVAVAGGVANLAWLTLWILLERLTSVSEAITVDRDIGAGIRVGAWLVAGGLIAGRGAAGDWFDVGSTILDFARTSWPMVPLAAVAILVERRRARRPPTEGGAWLGRSITLAMVYLAAAAAVLVLSPAPAENPVYDLVPVEIA